MTTRLRSQNPTTFGNSAAQPSHPEPTPETARTAQLDELVLHDLLNPMTGVLGQLEMLEDQLDATLRDSDRERLDQCLDSARDLSEMLVNLRQLCQLLSEQAPAHLTPTPVMTLLQTLKNASDWPTHAIVDVPATDGDATLHAQDARQLLERAMRVLGQAALRLSDDARIVFAAAAVEPRHVRLTCRWAGTRLPEPVSRKLFTPELPSLQRQFGLRVDRARGLELVHTIVKLLKGTVEYESKPGGGQFVVIVPQADLPNDTK